MKKSKTLCYSVVVSHSVMGVWLFLHGNPNWTIYLIIGIIFSVIAAKI